LRVLALLAERQGQLVTREELKKHLWPEDTFVDFETGLNTAVSKLRDALSDHAENPRYIETIPRRGYRFISTVEFVNGHRSAGGNLDNSQKLEPARALTPTADELSGTQVRKVPKTRPAIHSTLWLSLAAAVLLVGGGAYWLTHRQPALSFHSSDSVLIADFENQTGDPRFDNALGTAFDVSIAQSRYANVYPRMQLDAVLKRMGRQQGERITASLGREICQRENVRGLIVSSITRTGQEYSLTTELIDPQTGAPVRKNGHEIDGIEQYNQALRVLPDFAHAYIGIATADKAIGKYPDALQAYSKAFEIEPQLLTSGNINREYGFSLVANGEGDKAQQVFSALLDKPETRENGFRSLAFLDLYHGRYASAQNRLEQSLEILKTHNSPLSMARVQLLLAIVAEGRGDTKAQRKNLDAALAGLNDFQQKVLFGAMIGDVCARDGFVDQARKIAALITPVADQRNLEQMGYLHLLLGEIALSLGQNDKAIELLMQSDKENQTGFSNEALAYVYQHSGKIDEAVAMYEKMLSSNDRSLSWEPQQRWLEARYTLALDYASRGDKQKARETLATFLNLWKDADANLPLLKQAKAEYAKLQ